MSDAHELVCKVKDLALELGRTPNRAEFCQRVKNGERKVELFGGYSVLLTAAGLPTYEQRRARKIDNTVFETSIERHLENREPFTFQPHNPYPSIACISDIHWPFSNPAVIERFLEYVGDVKPEFTLIDGDAWDMYSHAKFPRSHNSFTPREERSLSRAENIKFWLQVKERAPSSQCVQLLGNHDVRPLKRVIEVYPSAEDWISEAMEKDFTFEGVKTIHDHREELFIGDIVIHHGHRSQLGAHRDYALSNCIVGHTHKGGVVYRQVHGRTIWELNCGLAGDPLAKGLTYTPQKITVWTPGFGAVDKLGPRFISL